MLEPDHLGVGRACLLEVGANLAPDLRRGRVGEQSRHVEIGDAHDRIRDPARRVYRPAGNEERLPQPAHDAIGDDGTCSSAAFAASDARRLEVDVHSIERGTSATV